MKNKKRVLTSVMLAFTVILMGTATALSMETVRCSFLGSWMGYDPLGNASWLSSANGLSTEAGTYVIESPGFDNTIGYPQFQDAVMGANLRGVWQRTGDYTYAFTVIGIVVDSDGSTLYIGKLKGIDTLAEDCNSMLIESSIELFRPTQNPFTDKPFLASPMPPHYGYRMVVDLPDSQ